MGTYHLKLFYPAMFGDNGASGRINLSNPFNFNHQNWQSKENLLPKQRLLVYGHFRVQNSGQADPPVYLVVLSIAGSLLLAIKTSTAPPIHIIEPLFIFKNLFQMDFCH